MTDNTPDGTTPAEQVRAAWNRRRFLTATGGLLAAGAGSAILAACSSDSGSGTSPTTPAGGGATTPAGGGATSPAGGGATSPASPAAGGGTTSAAPAGGGGKVTLKVASWEQFEQGEKVAWQKVLDGFTAANPNITCEWTGWPFATYDQNVIAQAQAGGIDADIVMCPPELASALINKFDMCIPLQSIAADAKLTPIPAHDQFKVGDDLFALGVIDVPFALTYDEKLLSGAGYSAPPSTLDELHDIGKALTKAPDQYGINLLNAVADQADWWNQLQNFPLAYGGAWASGKNLQFTSDPVVQSVKYWIQLLNDAGPKGSSEAAITKLWQDDRIAMNFNVAAGLNSLQTLAPKLYPNLRSAPPPWPGNKAIARLHPVVILKSSKNQDAAAALVKYMISPDVLYDVTTANGYPIIPFSNFGDFKPEYQTYLDTTPWMSGYLKTNYVGEFDILGDYTFVYAQIGQIICKAVSDAVSGASTVEDALKAAQDQAQQELAGQL